MRDRLNRRSFLTAGAALSTAPMVAGAALADVVNSKALFLGGSINPILNTSHLLDPTYKDSWITKNRPDVTAETLADFRAQRASGQPQKIIGKRHNIENSHGYVYTYEPQDRAETPGPALLYLHGGGYVVGSAENVDEWGLLFAQMSGAVVINAHYRKAPETTFPGPLEDAYDALKWTYTNADMLGIDPKRISVMGHSAGGGLAAALALLARDRGDLPIRAQFLIYPMLDYRTGTAEAPVDNPFTGEFVWTRASNRFGWSALRGDYDLRGPRLGHFSPALAAEVADLPPTFMSTGALDLFLEEDMAYGLRLSRAGVPVDLHVYPGAVHAFDLERETRLTRNANDDLITAMARWM